MGAIEKDTGIYFYIISKLPMIGYFDIRGFREYKMINLEDFTLINKE